MQESIVKVPPDVNGIRRFDPGAKFLIRLWQDVPRLPTDWFIVWGTFSSPPLNRRVEITHRAIFDSKRDAVLTRSKITFPVIAARPGFVEMDITVPTSTIVELEARL